MSESWEDWPVVGGLETPALPASVGGGTTMRVRRNPDGTTTEVPDAGGTSLTPAELQAQGYVQEADGVWRRRPTAEQLEAQGYRQGEDGVWRNDEAMADYSPVAIREIEKPELQQRIGAFAQGAAEQIPFLDEAAAWTAGKLYGKPYEEMRQRLADLKIYDEQENAGSRLGGQVAGFGAGLAAPGGGYIKGAQGIGRVARAGQVGAGYGALYGLGAGEGSLADRAPGGVVGAVTGLAAGAGLQAGANSLGRRLTGIAGAGQRPAPNLEQLEGAKNAAYQAVDSSGAVYSSNQIKGLAAQVENALKAENLDPLLHPRATTMLRKIRQRGDDMSLTQVDQLRQVIRRDVARSSEPGEQYMGQRMIEALDDFLDDATPAVGPENAGELIRRARSLNTSVRKVETITDAVEEARLAAGQSGSGGNINNAVRSKMRQALAKGKSWTPEERAALEGIIVGGKGQNFLRQLGKLSPEGNGLMLGLQTVTAVQTGGLSAPVMVGGAIAKRAADRQTMRAVEKLIEDIARGAEVADPETQVTASALEKLKAVDLSVYRAAVAQMVSRAAVHADGAAILPTQAAASPEETQP